MARAAKRTASKSKPIRKKRIIKRARGTERPVKEVSDAPAVTGATLAPLEAIERALEGFVQRHWRHPVSSEWTRWGDLSGSPGQKTPSVDIVDREKEVVVRAEIPGIDKEDLDLSIVDRTLTIKGSSRREEKEQQDDYVRHEIRSGSISRSLLLPTDVNASRARATFKDGIVELHLPKARASKRHRISVT